MFATLLPVATETMATPTAWEIFLSETFGTMVLIIFGVGTVATNNLLKSKGKDAGWVLITFGWGFAVYMGVYAAWKTGGHLNPAVSGAKWLWAMFDPSVTMNGLPLGEGGIPATFGNFMLYTLAQMVGAILGALIAWLAHKKQFDTETTPVEAKRWCFSTAPEVRSYGWNLTTEAIGTAMLIIFIMVMGGTPTEVGPLAVGLCIVVIGMGLGGPTGYAINPARDLGPRIAHAIVPMKNGKADNDWAYAWVPVVGPMIGAFVAVPIVLAFGMAA